jgi:hypothetical protein
MQLYNQQQEDGWADGQQSNRTWQGPGSKQNGS